MVLFHVLLWWCSGGLNNSPTLKYMRAKKKQKKQSRLLLFCPHAQEQDRTHPVFKSFCPGLLWHLKHQGSNHTLEQGMQRSNRSTVLKKTVKIPLSLCALQLMKPLNAEAWTLTRSRRDPGNRLNAAGASIKRVNQTHQVIIYHFLLIP